MSPREAIHAHLELYPHAFSEQRMNAMNVDLQETAHGILFLREQMTVPVYQRLQCSISPFS